MIQSTFPHFWNSAHDPDGINLVFQYESQTISANTNAGGRAKITIDTAYTENSSEVPEVGEYLIIKDTSHAYYGRHQILTVHSSTQFTINKTYSAGASTGVELYFERIPTVELYKGYNTGEEYDSELPLTLVATFTPRPYIDTTAAAFEIRMNLSGYLSRIFTLQNPITTPSTDFTMFNRFRLKYDGALDDFYYVVNAAIPHATLNEYYADTGAWLVAESTPFVNSCGYGVLTKITDAEVINVVGDLLTIITAP